MDDAEKLIAELQNDVLRGRDAIKRVKRELYSLCEDTENKYHDIANRDHEGKQGAFARGRCVEAKSIARAMGEIFHELERQ